MDQEGEKGGGGKEVILARCGSDVMECHSEGKINYIRCRDSILEYGKACI